MRAPFNKQDREAIEAALNDPDEGNPIALAVAEAMQRFMGNLAELARQTGSFPTELLLHKPETAFDDVVIRLTVQTIADTSGRRLKIRWIPR